MAVGIVLSVWLFSNESSYTGLVPNAVPEVGDVTFLVAGGLYAALFARERTRDGQDAVLATPGTVTGGATPAG
jgi:hypothetical protein